MSKFIVVLLLASIGLFAKQVYQKDAEQFKAVVNFEKVKSPKIILKATPKKDWHINDSFPVSFKPENTCLKFDKKKYKKKDVKVLKETE